jgi:hypothetical protein
MEGKGEFLSGFSGSRGLKPPGKLFPPRCQGCSMGVLLPWERKKKREMRKKRGEIREAG